MMPALRRVGEIGERGLLDGAWARGHEDEMTFVELLDRQHRGDLLALGRKEIDDGLCRDVAVATPAPHTP